MDLNPLERAPPGRLHALQRGSGGVDGAVMVEDLSHLRNVGALPQQERHLPPLARLEHAFHLKRGARIESGASLPVKRQVAECFGIRQ